MTRATALLAVVAACGTPAPAPVTAKPSTAPAPGGGWLEPGELNRAILRRIVQIKLCYEKERSRVPELVGKAEVAIVVGLDGRVVSATATIHGLDANVGACLEQEARQLVFRPPTGGTVDVTYPFTFGR